MPAFRDWLTALVPSNAVKAAADGALLPFVVFVVCFAFAVSRTEETTRQTLVRLFDAITRDDVRPDRLDHPALSESASSPWD